MDGGCRGTSGSQGAAGCHQHESHQRWLVASSGPGPSWSVPPPGLESPTHALRADADPWASSATTTCVTLAEHHHYDRNVEIILYPCGKGCGCGRSRGGGWACPQNVGQM